MCPALQIFLLCCLGCSLPFYERKNCLKPQAWKIWCKLAVKCAKNWLPKTCWKMFQEALFFYLLFGPVDLSFAKRRVPYRDFFHRIEWHLAHNFTQGRSIFGCVGKRGDLFKTDTNLRKYHSYTLKLDSRSSVWRVDCESGLFFSLLLLVGASF